MVLVFHPQASRHSVHRPGTHGLTIVAILVAIKDGSLQHGKRVSRLLAQFRRCVVGLRKPRQEGFSGALVSAEEMGKQFLQVEAIQLVAGGIGPEVVIRALEGNGHGWNVGGEARASLKEQ